MENTLSAHSKLRLYQAALFLSVFTIVYNVAEGIIATWFGYAEENLTLFGFGADSFIEVISGLGVAQMVLRIKKHSNSHAGKFERTALRITGFAFFGLVIALLITGCYSIWIKHKPAISYWGLIISSISILIMYLLIVMKVRTGKQLHSPAILADAACAQVCIYMSVILLLSSLVYTTTGFAYIDSIGAFGLAFLSWREGKECFEKANNKYLFCEHHHH